MNLKPNLLIVSVFQDSVLEDINRARHGNALKVLQSKGVPCIELQGRYLGKNELSILVQGFENRELVERLSSEFNQKCYLESYNDRATFLVYPDGRRDSIGTLQNVSQDEAEAADGYSFNPISGQYFISK